MGPDAASLWVVRLGHASLWGGLGVLAVAALCRLLPRLSASVRASLWWLACLKIVLDLCWAAPITLPLLPAPSAAQAAAHTPLAALPSPPAASAVVKTATQSPFSPSETLQAPAQSAPHPLLSWPICLSACWIMGVLLSLALTLRQGLRMQRIVRTAEEMPRVETRGWETSALRVCQCSPGDARKESRSHWVFRRFDGGLGRLGFQPVAPPPQPVAVRQHPEITAPCVTGWLRPTILLPPGLADALTPDELRLTLAHEMAHVRRGDLFLAILPALARTFFFFHPLVWWAGAEWAAAREEACDALALQATGVSTSEYGRLLLKMASGAPNAPALGLSPGYHGLRRRLVGLTHPARENRRPLARVLLACILPLLLPWRLTAAVRPLPPSPNADSSHPLRYQITNLGEMADGDIALNASGQVAGTASEGDNQTQGLLWNAGQTKALGALPKHHASIAYGLNSLGQVAAASYNIPGRGRAFLWDGTRRRLGSLPGFPYSEARAVNDAGQVAGFAETGGHDRWRAQIARAFLWDAGRMADLGTLGGAYSYAYGLNNSGTVVGKADTAIFGQTHAFAWSDGAMQDLGTLGGANSLAYHVNDRDQIVGYSETGDGETRHAFLCEGGQMRDLGVLPGWADSAAYAVNSAGETVGAASSAADAPGARAILWRGGQTINLNTLLPPGSGWVLEEARAINDKGQIAGRGRFHGQRRTFLLTPRL